MISLKAHWVNAPSFCPYRASVETKYLNAALKEVQGNVRELKALYEDARKQPNERFIEIDRHATKVATAGLLQSESARAAFIFEFLNLGQR